MKHSRKHVAQCDGHFAVQAVPYLIFFEVRRSDFWQTFLHHVVTFTLIAYSYVLNLTRIGVIIMLLHDSCDIFMELAKLCRYNKKTEWGTRWFIVFALVWLLLRVCIFPIMVYSVIFASTDFGLSYQPHHAIFGAFLMTLLALNIFWSYLIARIIVKALKNGGEAEDDREEEG